MAAPQLEDRDWVNPRNQRRFTPIAPISPVEVNRTPVVTRRDAAMDEADMHSTINTIRNYLPESVGAIKAQNREILAKLDELLAGIRASQSRLDRLEDAQ